MEVFYATLAGILFVNFVYVFGKIFFAILTGVHERYIQIGFSPILFTVDFRDLSLAFGIYIPFPWLSKLYSVTKEEKKPLKYSWEHFDSSLLNRLLAIYGGAIASIAVAIFIFSGIQYSQKDSFISKEEFNKYGLYPSSFAREFGFEIGDRVEKINGEDYEKFSELFPKMLGHDIYTISRNDNEELDVIVGFESDIPQMDFQFFEVNAPFKITHVIENGYADKAEILSRDIIKLVNDINITCLTSFKEAILNRESDTLELVIQRNEHQIFIECPVDENNVIGIHTESIIQYDSRQRGVFESLNTGTQEAFRIL